MVQSGFQVVPQCPTLCSQEHAKQRSFPLRTGVLSQKFRSAYVQWLCSIHNWPMTAYLFTHTYIYIYNNMYMPLRQHHVKISATPGVLKPEKRAGIPVTEADDAADVKETRLTDFAACLFFLFLHAACHLCGFMTHEQQLEQKSRSWCLFKLPLACLANPNLPFYAASRGVAGRIHHHAAENLINELWMLTFRKCLLHTGVDTLEIPPCLAKRCTHYV